MHKKTILLSVLLTFTLIFFIGDLFIKIGMGNLFFNSKKNTPVMNFSSAPKVALINIQGAISGPTTSYVLDNLKKIEKNPDIKGVILKINSPGGTTGTSEEIYDAIMKLRKKGVFFVASIRDLGASGGYYISSACNSIVANPSSLTGSIGVIMSSMNFQGLANKVGVKSINFISGKMKDMLSPFRDMRPEESAYIQKMIEEIYNQFVNDVVKGRKGKISREKLLVLADGRVYTGIDAKKNGLIDELGGFDKAEDVMKKLLKTKNLSFVGFSKSYFQEILKELSIKGDTQLKNPLAQVAEEVFLKEHVNTPLYYSSLGGKF